MKRYIVRTHLGDFPTIAKSPAKALSNIRWRVFGGRLSRQYVQGWKVREA